MQNKELTIVKEISPVVEDVNNISISSPQDMIGATTYLSQLNKFLDALIEDKERLIKPANEILKDVRARYKPTEILLEEAIKTLKSKMNGYQQAMLQVQAEEEAKIAARVSKGTLKVETGIRKMEEIEAPEEKIKTDEGAVSFKTAKKFQVTDMSLLPMEYHMPDMVAIRKQMVAGVELPGVKYWDEQSIINRRN